MSEVAAYLICGILVGLSSGLFGIGGGIIGIPILILLLQHHHINGEIAIHIAIVTMLASAICTSSLSVFVHYQKNMILFSLWRKIIVGALIGSLFGVLISHQLNGDQLKSFFGVFLLIMSGTMFFKFRSTKKRQLPNAPQLFFNTTILGTFSSLLGLGGGILLVPYLQRYGVPMKHAVATAAACVVPVSILATASYILTNDSLAYPTLIYWPAFLGMTSTSLLFTPVGVKLTHTLPNQISKKLFALFLFGIGIEMLTRNIN